MTATSCSKRRVFLDGFPLYDKALMRSLFYGTLVAGAVAIGLEAWWWGVLYLAYALAATFYSVLWGLCSHCPFAYEFGDCLFFPHTWVTRRFAYRPEGMPLLDKLAFFVPMASFLIIPQFWIYQEPWVAMAFWALALPTVGGLAVFHCGRCRNIHCPLNTVEGRALMRAGLDMSHRKAPHDNIAA